MNLAVFFPPGFDKTLAAEAGALVNQAYAQFAQGSQWSLQGNYDNLAILSAIPPGAFAAREPFGFVARNRTSRVVFVTFRGTISIEDWLSNLTFHQMAHPTAGWGEIETGFGTLYQQCSASVVNGVRAAGATPRVIVTGHSLGGALATLATADLLIQQMQPVMYSFAAPRAGDPAFAARFNSVVSAAWRLANSEDIVTTVPLASPELLSTATPLSPLNAALALANHLNFEHVGTPVAFTTHNGSITANHAMAVYLQAVS